jgi:hypothetical protein
LFDALQHFLRIHGTFDELDVIPVAQTPRDNGSVFGSGGVVRCASHLGPTRAPMACSVECNRPGKIAEPVRTVAAANVLVGDLLSGLCRVDPLVPPKKKRALNIATGHRKYG